MLRIKWWDEKGRRTHRYWCYLPCYQYNVSYLENKRQQFWFCCHILSYILFLMHSGGKFREDIHVDPNSLKIKIGHPLVYNMANPYCFNHWQWCKQIILRVCVTHYAEAQGMRFVVFTRVTLREPTTSGVLYTHNALSSTHSTAW